MRFAMLIPAAALMLGLAACDDKPSCTQAQAQEKVNTLMSKITQLATTNPEKVQELTTKMQDIAASAQSNDPNDLGAACATIDKMIAELG